MRQLQKVNSAKHHQKVIDSLQTIFLLLIAFLTACTTTTGTPSPYVTRTFIPTNTYTYQVTQTSLPAQTVVPANLGTPPSPSQAAISADNVNQLEQIARWGIGIPKQISWSPDGKLIATAATQGLYVYNSSDLSQRISLNTGEPMHSAEFSPTSDIVVGGSDTGKIFLWQISNGRLIQTLQVNNLPVFCLAYSPDGNLLVSGSWDQTIRVWKTSSGELLQTLEGHRFAINKLSFSLAGDKLFSWSSREQPQVWDTVSWKKLPALFAGGDTKGRSGSSADFSIGGSYLALSQDNRIRVLQTNDGTTLASLAGFGGPVLSVALSRNAEFSAVQINQEIQILQTSDKKIIKQISFPGESRKAALLSFSPDGSRLAAAGDTLTIWSIYSDEAPLAQLPAGEYQKSYLFSSSLNTNSTSLTNIFLDGSIQSIDLEHGQTLLSQALDLNKAVSLAVSPQGETAAVGLENNIISIWSLKNNQEILELQGSKRPTITLSYSSDGTMLAGSSSENFIQIWNVRDGVVLNKIESQKIVSKIIFSPDNQFIGAAGGGEVRVWQISSGKLLPIIHGYAPTFSNNLIAVCSIEGGKPRVSIYQIPAMQPVITVPAAGTSLAISADDSLLAVSGAELSLWYLPNGDQAEVLNPPGPNGDIFFSRDGRTLILNAPDGSLALWGIQS